MADWWARLPDETATDWAGRILRDERAGLFQVHTVQAARHDELEWLCQSMTDDGIPEHIQALVVNQWLFGK